MPIVVGHKGVRSKKLMTHPLCGILGMYAAYNLLQWVARSTLRCDIGDRLVAMLQGIDEDINGVILGEAPIMISISARLLDGLRGSR